MTTKIISAVLGVALLLATAGSVTAADLYGGNSIKDGPPHMDCAAGTRKVAGSA